MITEVHGKPPVGVLYCHVDCVQRRELAAKATVSPKEYHKLKILLLVVTVACTIVDWQHEKSCCCYNR